MPCKASEGSNVTESKLPALTLDGAAAIIGLDVIFSARDEGAVVSILHQQQQ